MSYPGRKLLFWVVAIASVSSACTGAEDEAATDHTPPSVAPATSDVSIVKITRRQIESAPALFLDEEMRIGGSDATGIEAEFSQVTHLFVASSSEIFVLDAGRNTVLVFDDQGKFIRRFGRPGDGPGEFVDPAVVVASHDTILVLEDFKYSVFDGRGKPLRSSQYVSTRRLAYVEYRAVQRTPKGWTIASVGRIVPGKTRGQPLHDTLFVRLFDPITSERKPPVVSLLGPATYHFGDAGWVRREFLAVDPHAAIAKDGTIISTIGDEYNIRIHAEDGAIIREIQGDVERIPVTDAQFHESIETEIAASVKRGLQGETVDWVDMLKRDAHKVGHVAFRPVIGRLIVSQDGKGFLAERVDLDPRPLISGDSVSWDFFGIDGRFKGRLVTPPRMRPRILQGQSLFATVLDADDLPHLVKYRIRDTRPTE